ncbi:hypothetical protein KBZ08_12885 [Cyanobium sp. Candia 9D4]|uniref:hypothetical protein n=1 Tax=Cyanobium sp. Candia 9D4 TaxID=2823707 RepID=UPI0020CCF04E|nr:hypothetical protein [Cyanobium sp. Candia 9D4]MCP9934811.1 hypothetical protein [Cyanobium sp. Candia 9D4]
MGRTVIEDWRYEGDEKQWVLFTVAEGPYAGTVLQERYNLARRRYETGERFNDFSLTSVHDKTAYVRNAFLSATPRRVISEDWRYTTATDPIRFYFDPSDESGLSKCQNKLELFASNQIHFKQPWCEFHRSLDSETQEVWIASLEDINTAIRFLWRNRTQPGRLIEEEWQYQGTTSPVRFTLDITEDHDFYGVEFQQTIAHWSSGLGVNLRSVADMNQAIQAILGNIDCKLADPSFNYDDLAGCPTERFKSSFEIIDQFEENYLTTVECLTKGMTPTSIGEGQLPWNRITSRLTPEKIKADPRLLCTTGIFYIARISDIEGEQFLKIGITTKSSANRRCRHYDVLFATQRLSLLDIAILENALLRATVRHRPVDYLAKKFPRGFGGGNSEIRRETVLEDFTLVGNDAHQRFTAALEIASSFNQERKLSAAMINQVIAPLAI